MFPTSPQSFHHLFQAILKTAKKTIPICMYTLVTHVWALYLLIRVDVIKMEEPKMKKMSIYSVMYGLGMYVMCISCGNLYDKRL